MLVPIVGAMGGGKTATMTYLLYKDYYSGRRIFSNYKLNFPTRSYDKYKPEKLDLSLFADANNKILNNCSVGGDEFWIFADSRASASHINRTISVIVLQSRKRATDFYFTAQSFMQLDNRIRNNCDHVLYCKRKGDYTYLIRINRHIPDDKKKYKIFLPALYDLYDTNEIIDPMNIKKIQKTKENDNEEQTDQDLEQTLKLFKTENQLKKDMEKEGVYNPIGNIPGNIPL